MRKEIKRMQRGTVLFTTVSVMALLVIFLMGTLMLASASSNRAHKSYSSTQAEITAKATIDSFTKAMRAQPAVDAAVVSVAGTSNKLYPEINIADKSLGRIGYYDALGNFVDDHIIIEGVPSGSDYIYDASEEKWKKSDRVKIIANVRVGKEEESVVAYLRKLPAEKNDPNPIKGLQTAGGSAFTSTKGNITGQATLGIKNAGVDKTNAQRAYNISQKTPLDVDLMFVNGHACYTGGGVHTNVNDKGTGTVILGNLTSKNDMFIKLNYTMPASYTLKDIPYLYVDGLLKQCDNVYLEIQDGITARDADGSLNGDAGKGQPYNIFAGTVQLTKFKGNADMYLMDSYTDRNDDINYVVEPEGGSGTPARGTVKKADNILGYGENSDKVLYSWADSVVHGTAQTPVSGGGNVYCRGDLKIGKVTTNGSVRVEGNCTIGEGVTINGDLVVGGYITKEHEPNVTGHVYCGSGVGHVQVKGGYTEETLRATQSVDPATNGYAGNLAYVHPVTGAILGYTWDGNAPYTQEKFYKDSSGNWVSKTEATEFAIDATATVGGKTVESISNFGEAIYPANMTREKIYGEADAMGQFHNADTSTKIVKTLQDLRDELKYEKEGAATGEFSTKAYPRDVPSSMSAYKTNSNYAWTPSQGSLIYPRDGSGNITTSDPRYVNKFISIEGNISAGDYTFEVQPDSWVILKNVNCANDVHLIFDARDSLGNQANVNILIDGELKLNDRSCISSKAIYDKCTTGTKLITDTDLLGIRYYGTTTSKITYGNNVSFVGDALAPTLIINASQSTSGYFSGISYQGSQGNVPIAMSNRSPHWIGNAFIDSIEPGATGSNMNNFQILYSENGNSTGPNNVINTASGNWEVSYYLGA